MKQILCCLAYDYFVVGTDEHKRSLEAFLKEYDCFVPHIAAIPPGAIPEGKLKSKNNRRRGSIISASRLSPRKGIDILIKSVIKAHELNQIINLDIYGSGDDGYTIYLQNIVKDASRLLLCSSVPKQNNLLPLNI